MRRQIRQFRSINLLPTAFQTTNGPDISVELDDVPRSGEIVQAVDILGDQRERSHALFHLCERVMPGVRTRQRDRRGGVLRTTSTRTSDRGRSLAAWRGLRSDAAARSHRYCGTSGCRFRRRRPRPSGQRSYLRASTGRSAGAASADSMRRISSSRSASTSAFQLASITSSETPTVDQLL